MPITRVVPRPPSPAVPIVDPSGRMNAAWYAWLMEIIAFLAEVKQEVP